MARLARKIVPVILIYLHVIPCQSATVHLDCPAVPSGHGYSPFYGNYVCAYIPPGRTPASYAPGNNEVCVLGAAGDNSGYSHCSQQVHSDPLSHVTCDVDDKGQPGGVMEWIAYPNNQMFWYAEGGLQSCGNNLVFTGATSQPAPPVPTNPTCYATDNTILDYGSISINEFQGKKKNNSITVTCSDPTTVVVTLTTPRVALSNGGWADLTVGTMGDTSVTLNNPGGSVAVNVESTLDGTPDPGPFSGSTTVTVAVP
ncbi:MrpH family fimbial adhesin [Klebsiella aerogenes]|uniref:MrpH family fimbial adhesin n=1 Tax=Klebsiella aerogenes TaxID=548 RepID=UPI003FEEC5A3